MGPSEREYTGVVPVVAALHERIPKFDECEQDVVSRELVVLDGELALVMRYQNGLEVTLHVAGDRVWFEANRDWDMDRETGVVRFHQL